MEKRKKKNEIYGIIFLVLLLFVSTDLFAAGSSKTNLVDLVDSTVNYKGKTYNITVKNKNTESSNVEPLTTKMMKNLLSTNMDSNNIEHLAIVYNVTMSLTEADSQTSLGAVSESEIVNTTFPKKLQLDTSSLNVSSTERIGLFWYDKIEGEWCLLDFEWGEDHKTLSAVFPDLSDVCMVRIQNYDVNENENGETIVDSLVVDVEDDRTEEQAEDQEKEQYENTRYGENDTAQMEQNEAEGSAMNVNTGAKESKQSAMLEKSPKTSDDGLLETIILIGLLIGGFFIRILITYIGDKEYVQS